MISLSIQISLITFRSKDLVSKLVNVHYKSKRLLAEVMQRATREVLCLMLIAFYGAVGTGVDRVRMSMKISQDENWGGLIGMFL